MTQSSPQADAAQSTVAQGQPSDGEVVRKAVESVVLLCHAAAVIVVAGAIVFLFLFYLLFFIVLPLLVVLLPFVAAIIVMQVYYGCWQDNEMAGHGALCATAQHETRGGNGACAGVLTWFDGDVYLGQFQKGEFHG